jgi:hypothetical protein
MDISEDELRAMVRSAIARQTGVAVSEHPPVTHAGEARQHASHGLLALVGSGDADGQCIIEPSVCCNHCNYCQSLGH